MEVSKEEQLFVKRLAELSEKAYVRGIPTFTDFMNLNEYQLFDSSRKDFLNVETKCFGGMDGAERLMASFIPRDYPGEPDYPLVCLQIKPKYIKFAENLTHRDYLGAILNLGIERSKIGDILIDGTTAFLFCHKKIASFLISECSQIRHTQILLEEITDKEEISFKIRYETIAGTVSSLRIDSFLALALTTSRGNCVKFLKEGKVFCNNRQIFSANFVPKANEIISVRGVGRFHLTDEEIKNTKKGRIHIKINKHL